MTKIGDTSTSLSAEEIKVITVLQKTNDIMLDLLTEARNDVANIGMADEAEDDDDG